MINNSALKELSLGVYHGRGKSDLNLSIKTNSCLSDRCDLKEKIV